MAMDAQMAMAMVVVQGAGDALLLTRLRKNVFGKESLQEWEGRVRLIRE